MNNNNNNNNNNNVIEGQSASKPSDDTVDDWLNDDIVPWYSTLLIIKDMDKDKMYKDSKNNNIISANQSQLTSSPKVLQHSANFDGLFAGNDDDAAFFDTLGGGVGNEERSSQEMAPPTAATLPPHFAPLAQRDSLLLHRPFLCRTWKKRALPASLQRLLPRWMLTFERFCRWFEHTEVTNSSSSSSSSSNNKQTYIPPSDKWYYQRHSHPDVVQMPPRRRLRYLLQR